MYIRSSYIVRKHKYLKKLYEVTEHWEIHGIIFATTSSDILKKYLKIRKLVLRFSLKGILTFFMVRTIFIKTDT